MEESVEVWGGWKCVVEFVVVVESSAASIKAAAVRRRERYVIVSVGDMKSRLWIKVDFVVVLMLVLYVVEEIEVVVMVEWMMSGTSTTFTITTFAF